MRRPFSSEAAAPARRGAEAATGERGACPAVRQSMA